MDCDEFPVSVERQVGMLRQLGMEVGDVGAAVRFLELNSFQRFWPYCEPFLRPKGMGGERRFAAGTRFEDATGVYAFDDELRHLFRRALGRIEIGIGSRWASYVLQTYGEHGHECRELY